MPRYVAFFFWVVFVNIQCSPSHSLAPAPEASVHIQGVTLVAPPKAFPKNPMPALQAIGTDWLAVTPFGFSYDEAQGEVLYNVAQQWWGERPEGVRQTIALAKAQGFRVMLKPQVWLLNGWVGNVDLEGEAWQTWQHTYREYILQMAVLADSLEVDLFCVGTEYDILAEKYPKYWRSLIQSVKNHYTGPITYATNWDNYTKIPFWDALDFIGVDAYFPLSSSISPSLKELYEAWQPIKRQLHRFSAQQQRPILFTEWGYLTVEQCAHETWVLEKELDQRKVNTQAQANAYEALLQTFQNEKWWAGGFVWKWYPNRLGNNGEGAFEKDYTPQGKPAADVLKKYWETN